MTAEPFDLAEARRKAEDRVREYKIIEETAAQLSKRRSGIAMSGPEGDPITVSTTWLVDALGNSRIEGFGEGRSIVQALCDWANAHPKGWRDALTEHVNDPTLLDILDTMLERA